MRIGFVSAKGGVGKSTLLLSIAGAAVEGGRRVTILDRDSPQCTAVCWSAVRDEAGQRPPREVIRVDRPLRTYLRGRADEVVFIDAPGRVGEPTLNTIQLEIMLAVDVVVAPISPSAVDSWPVKNLSDFVAMAQRERAKIGRPPVPCLLLLNKMSYSAASWAAKNAYPGQVGALGLGILEHHVRSSESFSACMDRGSTPTECAAKHCRADAVRGRCQRSACGRSAAADVSAVWAEISAVAEGQTERRHG